MAGVFVGAIAAILVYWARVEHRTCQMMEPGKVYWKLRMFQRGQILLCEDDPNGKCQAIGAWGPPGDDPFEE